jgi:prolyl oligopeptidase
LVVTALCARADELPDPYLWLEDFKSPRVDAWVQAENEKTTSVLEKDPHYQSLYDEALAIAQAKDRIPTPRFLNGAIYNLWQDSEHVHGIWRKTTLDDYRTPEPHWITVLDLDQLSKDENANWFFMGANCRQPEERQCLVYLSNGGEDAITVREFDLATNRFAAGGFDQLPKGRGRSVWAGPDEILVACEWGPGTMTEAKFPFIVKSLKRGQKLDEAHELFRGQPTDFSVVPATLEDADGHTVTFIQRNLRFFESEFYLLEGGKTTKLGLPPKSQITDLIAGRLIVKLEQPWEANGKSFPAGSLVSLDAAALKEAPEHPAPTLVYAPGPRESLQQASTTRGHLIVTSYENVKGRAAVFTPAADGGWTSRKLDLPDDSSIGVVATDFHSDQAFLNVAGFLAPSTVELVDSGTGETATVKALAPEFDASKDVVEQREATSKDGTKIPYFVVHPAGMALNGENPTIIFAYGGFQLSQTPSYNANIGKLWLEKGGVYVLANIRGGGEFGPAWHEAGLKTHRQLIYDDFAAVAENLIAARITTPHHLGIEGGSNGGLLMGVELTQHPDLWNAVDIQRPLLDMLRFEKIAIGPSWVAEYGSVSKPEERTFLASISPYNNLKPNVRYPEPLVMTETNDDRVGPQHARKFAARLAEYKIPYLFYEMPEGGHGIGVNLKQRARTTAMEMTYFTKKLMQ